jgi:hypothetical protein
MLWQNVYIVTTYIGVCDYRRGMDWMIGFIGHFNIKLVTTINYSAIALLHTVQIPRTRWVFSIFTSCILTTDLLQPHCNFSIYKVFFSQPDIQVSSTLSQSQSHFTTCSLPPISSSWHEALWGPRPDSPTGGMFGIGAIHIQTHRLIGGIVEVRRWDGLRCHGIDTKFHKDWFKHSVVDGEVDIISLGSSFKETKVGLWDHHAMCLSVPLPLWLVGNDSVKRYRDNENTGNRRRNVGSVFFYGVRVVSKECRRLVLPRTSCFEIWNVG